MSKITCKRCGIDQDTTGLDQHHIFCLQHTGDENEVGIGLVCLNARSINSKSGCCPDCDLCTTEYRNGQIRGFRPDPQTGRVKEIFCL